MDKKEKKKKKKREEERETNRRGRERKKKGFHFSLRFTETGPYVFVGAKSKVNPLIEATHGYQNLGVSLNSKR